MRTNERDGAFVREPLTPRADQGAGSSSPSTGVGREITTDLGFGRALSLLQSGRRVARAGWNGKGQYIEMQVPGEHSKMSLPYIFIHTVQGHLVPWLASQTDLLASDWCVVSEKTVLVYGDE